MKEQDENSKIIEDLHNKACEERQDTYTDPVTGYLVFTKLKHLERGYCCKSGCRHCPYKDQNPKN